MTDNLTIFGSALFCALPILWLKGPKRSELWRSIKLWAEDNELAALVREDRRAARRPKQTATVSDNGREYLIQKGGAA